MDHRTRAKAKKSGQPNDTRLGVREVRNKTRAAMATLLCLAALGFSANAYGTHVVTNPHDRFQQPGKCGACHQPDEENIRPPEHLLAEDVMELCGECHSNTRLGRSHPVAVRPDKAFPNMNVPETLPLDEDGNVTCVTCHNPHLPYYSRERFSPAQNPLFCNLDTEKKTGLECYFQTYFLRVHQNDGGSYPLCKSCHQDQ